MRQSSSLRAIGAVLGVLLGLVAVSVVVVLRLVDQRERSLVGQHYRLLSKAATQLAEVVNVINEAKPASCKDCPQGFTCKSHEASATTTLLLEPADAGLELVLSWDECQGRLSMDQLIDRALRTHGVEGEVVLTTLDGTVLYQREHAGQRLERLLDLTIPRTVSDEKGARREVKPESIVEAGEAHLTSYEGVPHRLFVVPVKLPPFMAESKDAKESPTALYLCQFVPASSLRSFQLAFSPLTIAFLPFAVGLILLAWPVLKLRYMGQRDRLRRFEMCVLVVSCLLSTGITTFALLAYGTHLRVGWGFEDAMRRLAVQIERRFDRDVSGAYRLLKTVASDGRPAQLRFHAFSDLLITNGLGKPTASWRPAARLTDDGDLAWTIEPQEQLPTFTVADRPYFRDAQAGRFWGIGLQQATETDLPTGFAADAVRTRRNTQYVLALATPMRDLQRRAAGEIAIVGATLPSFDRPAVGPGFMFAVVASDGAVKLHANSNKSLNENLIDECERNPWLSSALEERRAGAFRARCYGDEHRLYVKPLSGTPWSTVVLQRTKYWDTAMTEIVLTWTTMFGGYLFVVVAATLLAQTLSSEYRASWLWPQRELTSVYGESALILATTFVFTSWAASRHGGLGRAGLLAFVPMVTVGLLLLRLQGNHPRGRERAVARAAVVAGFVGMEGIAIWDGDYVLAAAALLLPAAWNAARARPHATAAPSRVIMGLDEETRFRASYAAMLTALLAVLAAAPAMIIFDDARLYVQSAFLKRGNKEFTQSLETRGTTAVDSIASQTDDPAVQRAIARRHIHDGRNVYRDAWLDWKIGRVELSGRQRAPYCASPDEACRADAAAPNLLAYWTLPVLPSLTKFGARLRQSCCMGASDRSWCFRRSPGGSLAVGVADPARLSVIGNEALLRRHPTDLPAPGSRLKVLWFLIWAAVVLAAFGIVWAIARTVFLLDADPGGPTSAGPTAEGIVTVLSPRATTGIYTAADPHDVPTIDMRRVPGAEIAWIAERADVRDAPGVTLDHLEAVLDDPTRAEPTIALVRTLLRQGKTPVLRSTVDPLPYLLREPTDAAALEGQGSDRPATYLIQAWSDLLSAFAKHDEAEKDGGGPYRTEEEADQALSGRNTDIWAHATRAEKLAMRQLAEEGFLSPGNLRAARELVRKRLVRRTPAFALRDESLKRFLLRIVPLHQLEDWEREAGPSAWSRVQTPLSALVVCIAVAIFVIKPEMYQSAIGVVTGVSAGIPVLLRMFSLLGDQGKGGSKS